jgi:glycosyltransferase involved in cell wall biosynthesis
MPENELRDYHATNAATREKSGDAVLFVMNYRPNLGFAWTFIERLYAQIADHLSTHGVRTLVAYPEMSGTPPALVGSVAQALALDVGLQTPQSLRDFKEVIRREHVRVVYLVDRDARSMSYLSLRLGGAKHIVLHDHTSGARTRPRGLRRLMKWFLARLPWINADFVVAVSRYVERRQLDVGMVPPTRVVTVLNGVPIPKPTTAEGPDIRTRYNIGAERPIVLCACRATPEKGVDVLFRAFDRMLTRTQFAANARPVLIYAGNGPQFAELETLRASLAAAADIILAGYSTEVGAMSRAAALCVIPSIWQEACPLSVLESMAQGKAVIASAVGGIPEMITSGHNGMLVAPGDDESLATAIADLLSAPEKRAELGAAARETIATVFTPQQQLQKMISIIESRLGLPNPCA